MVIDRIDKRSRHPTSAGNLGNPQARQLEDWLTRIVDEYVDGILNFDADCAQVWGRLMSPHPRHPIDKQIAAIALIHGLTVVTRNVDDFHGTGVEVRNPFV